jgi:hypothetical protein
MHHARRLHTPGAELVVATRVWFIFMNEIVAIYSAAIHDERLFGNLRANTRLQGRVLRRALYSAALQPVKSRQAGDW